MNVWLHALLSSAAVGFVVAFLRAATLGDVVQRYSVRSKKSGEEERVLMSSMRWRATGKGSGGFAQNLSEPAFWRIVFGLWFSITAVAFAACAVMIWTSRAKAIRLKRRMTFDG